MSQWTVRPDEAGVRLDKYLAAPDRAGSRARANAALDRGKVFLNDREVSPRDAAIRLSSGDVVRLWMDRPGSARRRMALGAARDLAVVYEDEELLVLDKPAGVLAVPLPPDRREGERSVFDDLEAYLGRRRRPFVVHRIDRDTSGLVVFAATAAAQRALREQFKRRLPERVYLAVVYGRVTPDEGMWRDRLRWDPHALVQREAGAADRRATEAVSRYRVVESLANASLLEVRLVTGRQNQIRMQAGLHGHPLVGEQRYVASAGGALIPFARQALHARMLAFRHPRDGRPLRFESPLPDDMAALLRRLRRTARRQG
jgi:23S rRNA pseudouridine1911/1915/1917 synthase